MLTTAFLEGLRTCLAALGAAAILGTFIPLARYKVWWVRMWDFPRAQLAGASALALVGLPILDTRWGPVSIAFLGLLTGCTIWHASRIVAYTPLWPIQMLRTRAPEGPSTLRLLVTNVLMHNRSTEDLLPAIERCEPDMVLALETDQWWIDRLSEVLPDHHRRVLEPDDEFYGMALFSKLELEEVEVRHLLSKDIASIRCLVRLRSGARIRFYGLHPEPPAPGGITSSLERDAELILVGREIARERLPTVVAGDLNDVAWSHTSRLFRRLSRLLDPRVGRGLFSTFPADWPWLRWPLDHVFASDEFMLREIQLLPTFGSDHLPLFIAFEYEPRAAAEQEPDPADSADFAEARQVLRRATDQSSGKGASTVQTTPDRS